MGRSIVDRQPVHVRDLQDASLESDFPRGRAMALEYGHRTILAVPLLRENQALGTIVVRRREVRPFEDKYIALLKTFADQAAIAIENVRLFNETKESLERQTAVANVLKTISQTTFDLQAVFDVVVENATKLCRGDFGYLFRRDGDVFRLVASSGGKAELVEYERANPTTITRKTLIGRMALDRTLVHIPDLFKDPDYEWPANFEHEVHTIAAVPVFSGGEVVGAIGAARFNVEPFSPEELRLFETFADQAAIAIENVRLFNETKESLEQQTAISEVLRVISSTPSDVKPVLDAVADRAIRLCDAKAATIYVLEGDMLRRTAFQGPVELMPGEALAYSEESLTGRTIADGKVIHVPDIASEQHTYPRSWQFAQKIGNHTMLSAPLMREGKPFGTMFLRRTEVQPFSEKQIALATTFANQAAIAIENVRLFNETKEALEQQKASADVLGTISSSIADTKPVFDKILQSCERLFAGRIVGLNLLGDDGLMHLGAYHGAHREEFEREFPYPPTPDSGSVLAMAQRRVMHFPDVTAPDVPLRTREGCEILGIRSVMFAPLLWETRGLGAIFVGREHVGPFSEKEMALVKTFADQAVIAIQNARLFREIQDKSAQLEIANKHKSDFLANMSHELRTPLNAIIGFSEVLIDKMFGEVNEKQADYLKDIHESGKHLLSLINDILDLSKIEAGRMDLDLSTFHLPTALSNAMTLIRERAQRHDIKLALDVDTRLGEFQADERKVKQILLNLLSNAVKFTPDGGRVDVIAKMDTTKVAIAVKDTGIGIAAEDQAAVFEEFKQVGRDYTRKAEGTGLGLALTKRFVELHGGEISLASAPGKGSTFTITLPIRH